MRGRDDREMDSMTTKSRRGSGSWGSQEDDIFYFCINNKYNNTSLKNTIILYQIWL